MRTETRKQRYLNKISTGIHNLPVSLVSVNFQCEGNLAYVIRAAACFGADVHIIGFMPERSKIKNESGSTVDYVNIIVHKTPGDFLNYVRENPGQIVSAELCDGASSIYKYRFDNSKHTYIVAGHETTGVPGEILANSDKVFIPMDGPGYCLNTSQAANIMLYEWSRQRNG